MKLLLVVTLLHIGLISVLGQAGPKTWTQWAQVEGDWAQFQVIVRFDGGERSPEELATVEIKSLKVRCLIGGRIKKGVPPEIAGVKSIRILYSAYGKFEGSDGFFEDRAEIRFSGDGQNIPPVTIIRPATAFDVSEAARPPDEVTLSTKTPTILAPLGVEPVIPRKLAGRVYRVGTEWRRKGTTLEIRLRDYRTGH